ncbi:MAG: NPCBM/NEW2 domain-containing protein [Planctomycetes bacterium]|nr:NPCBM/NEW2 domain-containing protein [Planctomycetota bacterium]
MISFPKTGGQKILLTLTDGSQITAKDIEMLPETPLRVEAEFGATLIIPKSRLVSLRFLGGRVQYLSDLKPIEYEFTPYLSTRWPLQHDRNVLGGGLHLRGVFYPKGLGMHSKSRVTYELQGRYSRFQSVIGIDDSAGGKGSAIFAVEVDGKRVFTSHPLTGNSPAVSIAPISVQGCKRISLIVEYGLLGDIRDHANWCDAVLMK